MTDTTTITQASFIDLVTKVSLRLTDKGFTAHQINTIIDTIAETIDDENQKLRELIQARNN